MNNEMIRKTETLIEELKSICSEAGIGNGPSEYKLISQIFLYKYLYDKFIYEVKKIKFNDSTSFAEVETYLENITPVEYTKLDMQLDPNVARIRREYTISYLYNNQSTENPPFYKLFDDALVGISNDNIDIFSVKSGSEEKIKLFEKLSAHILEEEAKNNFFRAIINKLIGFSFEKAFNEKYDFFATVFEYLIKDYNKDFGKYAEYYTPNSVARIIAEILAPNGDKNVVIYDPSAGSGTLLLSLAHQIGEDNCTIYSQDISQKSNEFLRLNLILNNLVHSLSNVVKGNTLTKPFHLNDEKNRVKQFDYIVSNPPFKTDFSETRDEIASEKHKERFFAGVPKIKEKDKDKMEIYLCFIQHIMYSLKENGKAAIVVPTGFLTAKTGIEKKIREEMVDKQWLKGCISMPTNIFANTNTNVSIVLLDKSNTENQVVLIDASQLGYRDTTGQNVKTILSPDDNKNIVETYLNKEQKEKFSVVVNYDEIKQKKYNFSAGQYFEIKIETKELSLDEFNKKTSEYINEINRIMTENKEIDEKINKILGDLKYENS